MTPTRIGTASFAVDIVVSVVTRMWATTALPHGEFAVSGGLVFAGVAWLFGASYGYRAIQDEGR